jgi:hypothetical protein
VSADSTPGPWSIGPPHVVAQRATDSEGRRTTRFVAEAVLSTPLVEGEREANARLIAAAPEMLALLIRYRTETPLGNRPHMIAHVADAVIAKARGDQ